VKPEQAFTPDYVDSDLEKGSRFRPLEKGEPFGS